MSEKLAKLAQQLADFPAPSDPIEHAQHDTLKTVGAALACLPGLEVGLWRKRQLLKKAQDDVELAARLIGDPEGGIVQTVRRMRAIANSLVEGLGDPPE